MKRLLFVMSLCFVLSATGAIGLSAPVMYAHFINVGQADATLLEFPCGAILIDAGAQDDEYADKLVGYLEDFFDDRPDMNDTLESVIVTHGHIDHTRALRKVCETFTVKRYIDNGNNHGSGTGNPNWVKSEYFPYDIVVREIFNNDIVGENNHEGLTDEIIDPVGCNDCDPEIRILWGPLTMNPGWSHAEFDNKNNQSLVIKVDFGEASFLFTGDLERPAIETMLAYYQTEEENLLDVDVYQAGHHGSYNATTAELVESMTPEIAVISVGSWDYGKGGNNGFTTWYYGHPRKNVIDLLCVAIKKRRSQPIVIKVAEGARDFSDYTLKKKVYTTAADGNVKIRATLDGTFIVTRNN